MKFILEEYGELLIGGISFGILLIILFTYAFGPENGVMNFIFNYGRMWIG